MTGDLQGWLRVVENMGGMGILALVLYKLLDKWAGKFLEAQQQGAAGLGALAAAVKEGQTDQREVLLAIRVLSRQMEDHMGFLRQIEENCRNRGCLSPTPGVTA